MDNYIIWIIAATSTVFALSIFHYYTYCKGGKCKNGERENNNIVRMV